MNLLLALLLGHALGDFYFQTKNMVKSKSKYLLKHVFIYTVVQVTFYLCFTQSIEVLYFGLIVLLSHLLIDGIRFFVVKRMRNKGNLLRLLLFAMDQILHISVLVAFLAFTQEVFWEQPTLNKTLLLVVILAYLIMPSAILVDHVIGLIHEQGKTSPFRLDEGTLIGILERLLVFVLGISGNIGGIGFLIAAKTMVRYGQFDDSEQNSFRRKYLIGTLTSVLLGITFYLIYAGSVR